MEPVLIFGFCSVNRPFPNYAPLLTNKTFKSRLSANFSYICCTFSTWPRVDVSVCRQLSVIWKWSIRWEFFTPPGRDSNLSLVCSQQLLVLIYLPRKDENHSWLDREQVTQKFESISVVLIGWEFITSPGQETNLLQVSSQQSLVPINLPRKDEKLS